MKHVDYLLTTFSPAMFGEAASAHIRIISKEDADTLIGPSTGVVATRPSHERLAKSQFADVSPVTARYAMLKPGTDAIHIHYRGPQVPDDGKVPVGGVLTFYLIEADEYQEPEAA